MRKSLLSLFLMLTTSLAMAQGGKINKIIVGFPPGQATDHVARLLAQQLSSELGENFIVENKPGQGGSLGLAALARAEPDGHTMMLSALASAVVNPHLYKEIGYSTLKDFEPVAMASDLPLLLVINSAVPAQNLSEFIAYAKANPGKLNYGSSGNGTLSHLGMEEIKRTTGVFITHIPYAGSARSTMDLVSGGVQVLLDTVAVTQPHIRSGKVRLLATSYSERLPAFPDTPTIAEQLKIKDFRLSAWLGFFVPKGTPPERIARLSAAIVKVVQLPVVREKYDSLGALPRTMPTPQFRDFVKAEYERWGATIRQANLKVD